VLIAEGAETRGQGTASATITATCLPHGSGTSVEIETDLKITGKVAQFGRGVLQDVSAKLIGQFADCLANNVLAPATAAQSPAQTAETGPSTATPNGSSAPASEPAPPRPAPAPFSRPTPDAVDLGQVAGGAVAKRVVPVAAALVLLLLLWRALRARREATAYRAYRLTSSPGSPGSPARQVSST
jgi:hypothetical protein